MTNDIALTIINTRIETARQNGNTTEWYAMSLIKDEYQRLKSDNAQKAMWINEYSIIVDTLTAECNDLKKQLMKLNQGVTE